MGAHPSTGRGGIAVGDCGDVAVLGAGLERGPRAVALRFVGSEADVKPGTTEFKLKVRTSEGGRTTDRTVAVSVTNIPETQPDRAAPGPAGAFPALPTVGPPVSLGKISDPTFSGVAHSFRLVGGNDSGLFELDEASGELFFKGVEEDLDSGKGMYDLTVRVEAERH